MSLKMTIRDNQNTNKWEFPRILMPEEENGTRQRDNLHHRKRFHTFLIACLNILQDVAQAQILKVEGGRYSLSSTTWTCIFFGHKFKP